MKASMFIKSVPRNHIPWIIIGISYAICIGILLIIRWHLARENKRRDREPVDHSYDEVYIERERAGVIERVKVAKVCRVSE
jgi:ACS family allantoate permease-like MFS transporter